MKKLSYDDNDMVEDYYTCPPGKYKQHLKIKLIEHYLPVAKITCYNMCRNNPKYDFDDLFSHAQINLLNVIDRFKIKTIDSGKINSLSAYIQYKLRYLIIDAVRKEQGYRKTLKHKIHWTSLTAVEEANDNQAAFEDTKSPDVYKVLCVNDFWKYLGKFLTQKEHRALYYHYKLGYTMQDTGREMNGFSESRISQLCAGAIKKLRHHLKFKEDKKRLLEKVG
jgi:RNA polymerase sigma factor (sigma-70 family)